MIKLKKPYRFGKIIFLSLVCVATLSLFTYFFIDNLILNRSLIGNLEKINIESKLHQSKAILNTKIQELQKVAKDYGVWSECYYKIQEKDTEWFKENFSDWMPNNFNLDLLLVADKDKQIMDQFGLKCNNDMELLDDKSIENILSSNHYDGSNHMLNGLRIYNNSLYILGVSPVLESYENSDIKGVVIIGKKITVEFLSEINKQFDVNMLILSDNKIILSNEDYKKIEDNKDTLLREMKKKNIVALGGKAITASTNLIDISLVNIGYLIVVESPRSFWDTINLIRLYSVGIISICIIIILLLSTFLKIIIEKPMKRLENQIHEMADTNTMQLVDTSGPYEIGRLANAFNDLIVNLRMKQEENINLMTMSNTDELTSLYNKRYFLQYIEDCMHENKDKLTLMFCDIDYFKKINDLYGHQIGDLVLKEIGGIVNQIVGDKGKAFRYGGEELAIIVDECDEYTSIDMAERIRMAICFSKSLKEVSPKMPITISIGVALYPEDASNMEELIKKADMAMYYAKNNGRNQCQLFKKIMKD